jgi:hypothetical protein
MRIMVGIFLGLLGHAYAGPVAVAPEPTPIRSNVALAYSLRDALIDGSPTKIEPTAKMLHDLLIHGEDALALDVAGLLRGKSLNSGAFAEYDRRSLPKKYRRDVWRAALRLDVEVRIESTDTL